MTAFTVKGRITVKTPTSTSTTEVTTAEGLAYEGIHALVQQFGTAKARDLIEEHLKKYLPDYPGYGNES